MQVGKAGTIHNGNITDELALEFLSIKPSRIELFSTFPQDWQVLISDYMEDIDIEDSDIEDSDIEDSDMEDSDMEDSECPECIEKRKELEALKLSDLRELYPEITDTKKSSFIAKILDL